MEKSKLLKVASHTKGWHWDKSIRAEETILCFLALPETPSMTMGKSLHLSMLLFVQ